MDITRAQQITLDDALVALANRLTIGKSNLRLSSDHKSKEATLQVVYDVLKLTPFYKAFLISADVLEIYMQEFWATASVHNRSIRFKMNNKKHIVNLEYFREMLQICPKLPNQKFEEPPFEQEILTFLRNLGHSGEIKKITDVIINKLHQPWRSFAAVINKCLSGKDFAYQVEIKNAKKGNEIYYPHFTKVIVNFFMSKDPSIPRRNKINWHFPRDDLMFTTIKELYLQRQKQDLKRRKMIMIRLLRRSLPQTLKAKESKQLLKMVIERSKTQQHIFHASGLGADEGTDNDEERVTKDDQDVSNDQDDVVDDDSDDDEQTESDNNGDDFVHPKLTTHVDEYMPYDEEKDEDSFDLRVHTPPTDDEANDDVAQSGYAEEEELNAEHINEEMNVNIEGIDAEMIDAPHTTQVIEDTYVTLTPVNLDGYQQSSSMSSGFISNMINPNPDTDIDSVLNTESTSLVEIHDLPNFGSLFRFDNRLKALEQDLSEVKQTNQYATALSSIPNIVDNYLGSKLKEAVDVHVQLKSDRIREVAQAKNKDFFNKVNENMKKIIKEQVNAQVKKKIDKILPRIEKLVNEKLESEFLIRSSNEAKSSHAVAANLFELELKIILIDKMESKKSIDRSDEQNNLYKVLVDAYEADKDLLDAYSNTISIKRRRDDADDDQEPSAGTDRGSKRIRAGKEPESTSTPREKTTKITSKSTERSKSHQQSAGQSSQSEEPIHTTDDFEEPTHLEFNIGVNDDQPEEEAHPLPDWQEDPRESFDELMNTPFDFSTFMINRLKVDTLTPELLAGPTFELMKGTCKSLVELEYFFEEVYKVATEQLDWTNPEGQ
ncbi:hypothetical protein Tco_1258319 [Tanacetum coccineum]